MHIRTVGVIGAGVMGTGVAQNLAQAGLHVLLLDLSTDILQQARKEIFHNIRLAQLLKRGAGAKEDTATIIDRITFTTEYTPLQDADFVIENATEKWEVKKPIYEQLDTVCPAHCIFAANTSAISITRIASATRRPGNVLGIHFMNPVPMKPTVEMIRGFHTSEEALTSAGQLLTAMGKKWVQVQDMPGFVSNRVLMLTINEAIYLLQDQVASAEDVDRVFKECFGHTMGPLETADLIGLDTILYSVEVLYESFNDSKYRPCPLLKKMVDAGLYGRKNGQGFYTYK
ncbi:3-hydroxybutyryl-CoA dehydrogenase [Thermosporothrix hazakensis]|uniref:3-hydroxybutyryl-CoA dehydrogenase n=2 Tax=Thermosporothrix TaxID=768650 RepID=A0A326U5R0_THEHA|nr:3-hydroxyacyl-CoA dehydrogenase NAD-binding domain-containing protein [Thermosporothrix hazakensis]PZW27157.1 3-hydroxybutyryl-CoA dehydrogenase [Thermosporothrix hazakensis]BBH88023.1 3-hydroxybutyryl-CoA dehydrogenase [Thermosporothrix sp. COM3]GCE50441.1 3-hydroxybutyryl-CoA dehydrogenase [Thermosporothrix hazakensis]